jgi:hypothetical protein
LVTGYPDIICRVVNFTFNTISIYFNSFCRGLVTSFNELENASTSKGWDDKSLPYEGIVTGKKLCGWRTQSSGQRRDRRI